MAFVLSSCKEQSLPKGYVKLESLSSGDLIILAEQERAAKDAEEAVRLYSEVERLYPYSHDARTALIQQASIHLLTRNYEESRAAAQRFIDFYPRDKDADYAQYLYALSYYNQIDEIGRDSQRMMKAHENLLRVTQFYPDSEYAASAMAKIELVENYLAAKEMEIGRYYLKHRHFAAAANRFRTVIEIYNKSNQTPEALHRLVEVYLSIGFEKEAQTAGALLGHNFPSSKFYAQSYQLLTNKGLLPEIKKDTWLSAIGRQTFKGEWL